MADFLKQIKNDIYLTSKDISVLDKYEINYLSCSNMKELLFKIETVLNNEETDFDLEDLSIKLSEYNYYYKTNKYRNYCT